MSEGELGPTLRAWLAHVVDHDPGHRRFGARHHGYRLGPPLGEARVAAIEAGLGLALPADYRRFVAEVGDGGAGPYLGLMPLDHPLQQTVAAGSFTPEAPYQGVIGLGHLGCGYLALLVVRGDAAGSVWLDLRGAEQGVVPAYPDFSAYYRDWIDHAAHARLPEPWVLAGRCALPAALSSYLGAVEERQGLAPGSLAGDALREALEGIGPGGIACSTAGDDPFFTAGEPIDPCVRCEQLIENLLPLGLRRDQIVPGLPPIPLRAERP